MALAFCNQEDEKGEADFGHEEREMLSLIASQAASEPPYVV